ncbi:MAG: efflux transporter outer membrane subunit [Candidatus Thiodiazotropha taylori]|nr:efflux transporter outer membrane subunit [Candidatus Thiodiazotropha taylori]
MSIVTAITTNNNKVIKSVLVCGLIYLSGCETLSETPYVKPTTPDKAGWVADSADAATDAIDPQWWKGFEDPYLNQLIELAIRENSDLAIAMARLNQAGAAIGEVEARTLPSLSSGLTTPVSYSRNPVSNDYETNSQYSLNTKLNWELDIWGKLQKGVEAKQSAYRASQADWRAVYLNTATQVASSYFLIRQFDAQIDIQQASLSSADQILAIYKSQNREGLVSSKEVLRQQAELNSLKRTLIDLQRERKITENALATLLGQPAGNLQVPQPDDSFKIADMPIPAGLPSQLLRRRPDILAAEYRVLEAHQLVGQAKLAKLPSISLTTNAQSGSSLASAALNTFLKTFTFGLTPNINFPIFNPDTEARIKRNEASKQTEEAKYRKTVLIAFQEVEDALVNLSARRAQRQELFSEEQHLSDVQLQVAAQMREGIATQLEVFESERRLLSVRQTLLNNRQQILSETLTLYKAMGGGWNEESVQ